jgi:H+-translocating NAD(P) transhydrogenase subunit alpha
VAAIKPDRLKAELGAAGVPPGFLVASLSSGRIAEPHAMNIQTLSHYSQAGPVLVPGAPPGHTGAQPLLAAIVIEPPGAPPGPAHSTGPTTNEYLATLFVFMLATFVGLDVIRRVSRLLHTPLMSLTNAISAIAVVGSILVAGQSHGQSHEMSWINILGLVAVTASIINIVSGFLITDRMLKMFKKREGKKP